MRVGGNAGGAAPIRLLHAFSTFELGGPQARFVRLVRAFGPRFHHVVAAMDNQFAAAQGLAGLSNVELLPLPTRRGRDLNNVPLLWRTLGQVRPERLVTYNWGAFEWSFANAARRVPQLHVEEGFGPQETERRLPRRSMARRVGLRLAGAQLVVVSETMADIAASEWGVRGRRLVVVPNGVDVDDYRPAYARRGPSRFAESAGETVVGTVAGLRPEKRIDRLIGAFAAAVRAPDAAGPMRLVIAGDGPCRAALQAQAEALGVAGAVRFLGFVADCAPLYEHFDVMALTSDTEQMPLAVVEAMAAGLPIVATDVGDVRRMVGAANAELVLPPDEALLAGALRRLCAQPEQRCGLGRDNRARAAQRYTRQRMEQLWSGLYAGSTARAPA